MNKILTLSLFIIIGLFCSQSNAQKIIKLNPNESRMLANNSLWTLNATCVVQSTHPNNKIKVNVIKNSGMINGKKLSTGQGTLIRVKNNSSLSVSAESGTQINLINLGSDELQAVCST